MWRHRRGARRRGGSHRRRVNMVGVVEVEVMRRGCHRRRRDVVDVAWSSRWLDYLAVVVHARGWRRVDFAGGRVVVGWYGCVETVSDYVDKVSEVRRRGDTTFIVSHEVVTHHPGFPLLPVFLPPRSLRRAGFNQPTSLCRGERHGAAGCPQLRVNRGARVKGCRGRQRQRQRTE